ncbi:hypothetical protein B7463_g7900, partial [Scytalidium lignicola]
MSQQYSRGSHFRDRSRQKVKRLWQRWLGEDIVQATDGDSRVRSSSANSSIKRDDSPASKDHIAAPQRVKREDPDPSRTNASSISQHLWDQAYKRAQQDPELFALINAYKNYLEDHHDPGQDTDEKLHEVSEGDDGAKQLERIQKIAQSKLDSLEQTKLAFSVGKRKIVVREQLRKVISVVLVSKDIISTAISTEPCASLAWGGIVAVLPLLDSIFQQDEDAVDGFEKIAFLLIRYKLMEDEFLLLESNNSKLPDGYQNLVSSITPKIINIYFQVYRYQIRIVLQYVRGKPHRLLRNLFKADDWKEMLKKIEAEDQEIGIAVTALLNNKTLQIWKSVDNLLGSTEAIKQLQETTLSEVETIHENQLLSYLPFSGNALFDSLEENRLSKCLPGTQHEILKKIQKWAESPSREIIFWLHGMAGTGKSSIARTVANALNNGTPFVEERQRAKTPDDALNDGYPLMKQDQFVGCTFLGASYFFSQGDPTRNNAAKFFSTIAKTLAQRIPRLRKHIITAIQQNPDIGTKGYEQQVEVLILDPFSMLEKEFLPPIRFAVVIDALDECRDPSDVETMLNLLRKLENLRNVQVKFLIISRPESHIHNALPEGIFCSLALEKIPVQGLGGEDDLTLFLMHQREQIARRRQLPRDWLKDDEISKLREKADGLFIYAATVCRFLDEHLDEVSRKERLEKILRGTTDFNTPQQNLDEMYRKVLEFSGTTRTQEENNRMYASFRNILGRIALLFEPVSITTLSEFLDKSKESVDWVLAQIRSVVDVPEDELSSLGFVHLSFRDFLLSKERCGQDLWIDEIAIHQSLFERSFEIMNEKLHQDMCNLRLPGTLISEIPREKVNECLPQHLRYSCRYWVHHLEKLDPAQRKDIGLSDDGKIHIFLREKLLYWLEALSLIGEMPASILIINRLKTLIKSSDAPQLYDLVQDARRFVLSNRAIIEQAPMQTYCSALMFCPMESIVRKQFSGHIPLWITQTPVVDNQWSPELFVLESHAGWVLSVASSPDGNIIASGSTDGTMRLWDAVTGAERYRFQDPMQITCVTFSPDGKMVASGGRDGVVRLREFSKGEVVNLAMDEEEDQDYYITSVAFSPEGGIVASGWGSEVKWGLLALWDIEKRKAMRVIEITESIDAIAFSPDGKTIAVGCTYREDGVSGRVRLWDVEGEDWRETTMDGSVVVFLTDGKLLAAGSGDGTIKVWDADTTEEKSAVQLDEWITAIAFSPRDRYTLAVGLGDGTITFLNIDPVVGDATTMRILRGHGKLITSLAFSSDGALLALASESPTVRLWDTAINTESEKNDCQVEYVKFSPDGKLAVLRFKDNTVQIWDGSLTNKVVAFENVQWIHFSQDSTTLALVGRNGFRLLNTRTWAEKAMTHVEADFDWPTFSPGNRVMWSVTRDDNMLHLWDLETGKELIKLSCYDTSISSIFLPDEELVAFHAVDLENLGDFLLLEIATGKRRGILQGRIYGSFAFDFASHYIVTNVEDNIIVYEASSGKEKFTFQISRPGVLFGVYDIAISPLGKVAVLRFAGGQNTIQLWDGLTGTQIGTLNVDGNIVNISFSNDSRYLVSRRGQIPLPPPSQPSISDGLPEGTENCLYVGKQWIVQGFWNLLWLPPAYRDKVLVVKGQRVILKGQSRELDFLEFDLSNTSLVNQS